MREAGFDYFENSRRETYANRAYCIANPMGWRGYSGRLWGLTACDGPGDFRFPTKARLREFFGYARARAGRRTGWARRRNARADCGAWLAALRAGDRDPLRRGDASMARDCSTNYGFQDSFNPSFTFERARLETGTVDFANRLGREGLSRHRPGSDSAPGGQLPDDFIWRYMRRVPAIRRGLNAPDLPAAGWPDAQRLSDERIGWR